MDKGRGTEEKNKSFMKGSVNYLDCMLLKIKKDLIFRFGRMEITDAFQRAIFVE